jgi:branched-chain amino acid transport system permease protein
MFSLIGQLAIEGLGMGLIYVLLAAGLVLILNVPRVFFIAYGQFYMVGAYTVWGATVLLEMPFIISLILSVIVTGVLGAVSYRIIFHYIQNVRDNFLPIIVSAIGLMMIMQQGALLVFGTSSRGMPSAFPGMIEMGEMRLSVEKLVLIIFGLLVTGILYLIIQKTKIGLAMRAVSFRSDVSALQGINPKRIYMVTMGVGCALSGFAGGVMAPVYAVSPDMGGVILTVMLVIMLGGMGSMMGAVLGGIILGMTLSFGHYFIGAEMAEITLFLLIGIILFFRPGGLLGKSVEDIL